MSSEVLYELPEDDSSGIETCSIVYCRSWNTVVFD